MEIHETKDMDGKIRADRGNINAGVRISGAMPQPATTRWNPTPEQLMTLEELYRGGIRTPNADQIQRITAYLTLYGKIEGKNVFYWFQNHKARDRQKLRRKMDRKHNMLGALQQESSGHEMQKMDRNSTEESCTSSLTEHEWEIVDIRSATTTTGTRPPQTLELFPMCSGNLSNEKQIYSNSLSECRLFVEEDRQR